MTDEISLTTTHIAIANTTEELTTPPIDVGVDELSEVSISPTPKEDLPIRRAYQTIKGIKESRTPSIAIYHPDSVKIARKLLSDKGSRILQGELVVLAVLIDNHLNGETPMTFDALKERASMRVSSVDRYLHASQLAMESSGEWTLEQVNEVFLVKKLD